MKIMWACSALWLAMSGVAEAGKGKKKKKASNAAPPIGWHQADGWLGSCYFPPDFSAFPSGTRRAKWQEARDALISQWRGERNDGVSFTAKTIEDVETALLSQADRIESVAKDNLELCKKAMAGGGMAAWTEWLVKTPGRLTAGECRTPPMTYTLFDYLSINHDWQIEVPLCSGDSIEIIATTRDMYRIQEDGAWINVEGDPNDAGGTALPCNIEGCPRGMLIMRFSGESGIQQVLPVGSRRTYTASEHGSIQVMINDDSMSDNVYRTSGGIEDHTSITYKPAE